MYTDIEKVKDDMVKVVVFGKNPNENTYKAAIECEGLKRVCYEGMPVCEVLARVPMALQYLSKELSRLVNAALQREIDERVWYVLHPKKELTQDEQDEIAEIKYRIYVIEQADSLSTDDKQKIRELIERLIEIRGDYPGRGW